jgi:hypothetical protein
LLTGVDWSGKNKNKYIGVTDYSAPDAKARNGPKWGVKRKNLPESRSWEKKTGKKVRLLPYFASKQWARREPNSQLDGGCWFQGLKRRDPLSQVHVE